MCDWLLVRSQVGTTASPDPPRAGDFTICWHCTAVLKFLPGLALREMQPADWEGLTTAERRDVEATRAAVRQARRGGQGLAGWVRP